MNTKNFKPFLPTWDEVFSKQRELKFKYEPEAQELFANFDIDCFEDQELFKKYCWRITEELAEAEEAYYFAEKFHGDHVLEELIDAFNFSLELMLLYGWKTPFSEFPSTNRLVQPRREFAIQVNMVTYTLGITANCLKNRQWRRSQYLTDLLVFEERLKTFFGTLYQYLVEWFGSEEGLLKAWSLKYQVNLFRIQTNY